MYEKGVYDNFSGEVRPPAPAVIRGPERPLQTRPGRWSPATQSVGNQPQIVARYLHKRIVEHGWIEDGGSSNPSSPRLGFAPGVAVRGDAADDFSLHPPNAFTELSAICWKLDIAAAFTMRSETVAHFVERLQDHQSEVTLQLNHLAIPVVASLHDLATFDNSVRRRDYACFVRDEGVLLLWSQTADELLAHAGDIEDKLVASIWGRPITAPTTQMGFPGQGASPRLGPRYAQSMHRQSQWNDSSSVLVKDEPSGDTPDVTSLNDDPAYDIEDAEAQKIGPRPIVLTQSIIISLACLMIISLTAGSIRDVIIQVKMLGSAGYDRLAMLATVPLSLAFCLFFFTIIVNAVFQLIGPIKDIRSGNSRYYSSVKPDRKKHPNIQWPHMTIQMPVYKEGIKGVIQPTINSLLPAIAHYERLGGTASIFVADDGMQVVSPELAELRKKFYQKHGIGWVARPPHGKDGFIRGGRFKKASNLNYALDFTLRVEDELLRLMGERARELGSAQEDLDIKEEDELYEQAVATMLKHDEGRTLSEGHVRMGDIILLIDSDTRVPVDCLSLAAMEMEECPEVAIIQHASGVLKVTDTWFEACIAYFTDVVYLSIKYAVGNGDAAPFVGHNAFLRWKAMQSVRFTEKDGRELFWSEAHVSEDFDMALRLQTAGFVVRLATYDEGEFKEGVSLTIFDELLRWEKYAYGCSELLFHPIYFWLWKGPVTPMVWKILTSNMRVTSKFTIFGYVFTYYAIAGSFPLTLGMYFGIGWFQDEYQIVTFDPWKVFLGVIVIFQLLAPICFAVYRYRVGNQGFWKAWWENLRWSPFFMVFFAGISWHLCYALIAHLFCLPIEWASTAKELEATGFFISFDRVLKTFRWAMLFSVFVAGGMVYLARFAPAGWTIDYATGIVPLATQVGGHILLPILCLFH